MDGIRRKCAICGASLQSRLGPPFCPEHAADYEVRQRTGVVTDALDPRWQDNLSNWRECPAPFSGDATAGLFRLVRRWEDWLLFQQGYPARVPDWIAVHERTGEARRFVEVDEMDVRDDLLGVRPAPYQERLEQRWLRPEPREPFETVQRRYLNADGAVALATLVGAALMPVYGLAAPPHGLTLRGIGWEDTVRGPMNVELTFATPPAVRPNVAFQLRSADLTSARRLLRPRGSIPSILTETALRLWKEYGSKAMPLEWADLQRLPEHRVVLAGRPFVGEVLAWEERINRFACRMTSNDVIVSGAAFGTPRADFLTLLQSLVVLNDHPDLLAHYQAEHDLRRQPRQSSQG